MPSFAVSATALFPHRIKQRLKRRNAKSIVSMERGTVTPTLRQFESLTSDTMNTTKPRLTPDQRKARAAYEYAERQEDRYMGSVFANAHGQRQYEQKTREAYEACKRLGMTHEHGL